MLAMKIKIMLLIAAVMFLLLPPTWAQEHERERENNHPALRSGTDTVSKSLPSIFRRLGTYIDSLGSRHYRDSLLRKLEGNHNMPPEADNNVKSEQQFLPYEGKVIRHIFFRQVDVFGPRSINDTAFHTSMKLIRFANRLHRNTRLWAIRQGLFFREKDTVNAYQLADNERYLRNQPFMQDARIYLVNMDNKTDSADVLVVTKDMFEYGGDLGQASTSNLGGSVYNTNLLGAAQKLQFGFRWDNARNPVWSTELNYTKYNLGGSFANVSLGYTFLNNIAQLDTGVYEGSYYLNISRPLYRPGAKLAGGITLANNYAINAYGLKNEDFRDYRYIVFDTWMGYNFRNQFLSDGRTLDKANLAIVGRYYNLGFQKQPSQTIYRNDPIYNNRRYYLGQFVMFRQDFFKSHYFFGFGRTEDIAVGYNYSLTAGTEDRFEHKRIYLGLDAQQLSVIGNGNLINAKIGVGGFWKEGESEDAVINLHSDFYSRLLSHGSTRFRQFFTLDYLICLNNVFYKPLDLNYENAIWGFNSKRVNGFQRLNLRSETVYYSPLSFYGFKFNFFAAMEVSQIGSNRQTIFNNPLYAGLGAGCRIRNENLPINTVKLGAYYYPNTPEDMRNVFFELTTIVDFRFNISALQAPSFIRFK